MQLLSVNIGKAQSIQIGSKTDTTGIFKKPVAGPVEVTAQGLAGDAICDTRSHGGVDQAIYIYTSTDYAYWADALSRDLAPGLFGENLTISDLESAPVHIGDRLRVGAVLLEVTAPRIPCDTFAARMGEPTFVKRFSAAERPGLYCRVIEPGVVQAGDPVQLAPYTGEPLVTIQELFRFYYDRQLSEADIRRVLAAPIAIRERQRYEKRAVK
jgi:MOSC domain-containing protein YiiM